MLAYAVAVLDELVHSERVHDAREAAALLRALGIERVRLTQHRARAWVIKDRAVMSRALDAVEPGSASEIAIEGITRASTLAPLAELIASDARFIFIAGNGATLRVWPEQASVDQVAVARDRAFERFRDAASDTWINAMVTAPSRPSLVRDVVAELDQAEVELELDLTLATALEIALAYPDAELEWSARIVVQLPQGLVMSYLKAPIAEAVAEDWRASIDAAFARIRATRTL